MIKSVTILFIFLSLNVVADQKRAPILFEPIYAYQQKNITFDSLWQEINQFQNLSYWHSVLGNIESKRLERDVLRKAYERGKKLYEKGGITRREYVHRKFRLDKNEAVLAELESRAEMTRVSAEIARYGMQQTGDEQLDLRREIAGRMRESLQHEVRAMERALVSARLSETHLKEELDQARILHQKGTIPLGELERREMDHADVLIQVETLGSQIQVLNQAIGGFNKSLERLFGEAPKGRQG